MKIYLENLGKYNDGERLGEWLQLPYTEDELEELLIRIKVATRTDGKFTFGCIDGNRVYEEYAIHDYETEQEFNLYISEYEQLSRLNDIAQSLEGFSNDETQVINAFFKLYSGNVENAELGIRVVEDKQYIFYHDCLTEKDLGYTYMLITNQLDDIGSEVKKYIDFEKVAKDLLSGGTFVKMDSKYIEFIH